MCTDIYSLHEAKLFGITLPTTSIAYLIKTARPGMRNSFHGVN